MSNGYEIASATEDDIDDILDLQERNLPHRGGTLSARFPREWFEVAIRAMPVIVARQIDLLGYLVSSPIDAYADVPVVQAMLKAYVGAANAYIYGPVRSTCRAGARNCTCDVRGASVATTRPRGYPIHPARQLGVVADSREYGHSQHQGL